MSVKLDWIEKQAADNLRFRLNVCEILAKESHQLLMLLLAGIGAVLAYIINNALAGLSAALLAAAINLAIWLMVAAFVLVYQCIMTADLMPLGNEPKNLLLKGYTLLQIKEFELQNVQASIEHTISRNRHTAYWLDKCRLAAIISPIIFMLTWAAWSYL